MLINLHSHLEGRVRPDTAAELARAAGVPEPDGGWAQALRLDGPADLTAYLAKVALTYPLFDRPAAIFRITREAVEDAAADGGDYLELRFGPATHARDGLSLDDVVAAACDGAADAARATGMAAGVVLAALRSDPPSVNEDVARVAVRHAGRGVVGFDLAGDELRHPDLSPYRDAFAIARGAGLGLTCHAAEAAPAHAARAAVELLGVTRIGHGARVADDPQVLAWLRDHGIVVEVCPTSNWYTGAIAAIDRHPAATFRAAGLDLVLGDDNPVQTGSLLSSERRILADRLGFGADDLRRLDDVSIGTAFVSDSERRELIRRR